jgi:hypothetical protein
LPFHPRLKGRTAVILALVKDLAESIAGRSGMGEIAPDLAEATGANEDV